MSRILALVPAALLSLAAGLSAPPATQALPRVSISVPRSIPNEPKVAGRMTVRDGRRTDYRGRIAIEQRGQSSRVLFPKKSWSLETRTASGSNRSVKLLGLPKENDWILYAAYNDKTLMRNVLAYETARGIGRYASRTRFVEVTLNGRYHGVYALMERLKLDGDRVDVKKPGRLLEWTFDFQARQKGTFFRLPVTKRPILFEDPERGDLSRGARAAVQRSLSAAEHTLYGARFADPERGWRSRIDEAHAIDYVLLNELFKNEDAFHGSTYLARGGSGRWLLGPLWDLDVSMGNSDYGPSRFLGGSMLAERHWASRLYGDERFVASLAARWRALRSQGLASDLARRVDRHASALTGSGAAGRNFRRWPVLGKRLWSNPPAATTRRTTRARSRRCGAG